MKKHVKRAFTAMLAVIMLIGSFGGALASGQLQQDMQDDEPSVNRAMFAEMIVEAFGLPPADVYIEFYDVPADHDFAEAIRRVSALSIMVGNSLGYFSPYSFISGAEAAVTVNNVIGFDGTRVPQRTDLSIPRWAVPAASVLLDLTMVDQRLIETPALSVSQAQQFINALLLATMIAPGTPYALVQVELRDNLFSYVNRRFLATGVIPPGGIMASTFGDVSELVRAQLEEILTDILRNTNLTAGSYEWKIREVFNMFLDNDARIASLSMLDEYFEAIRNVESIDELLELAGRHYRYFYLVPYYSLGFIADARYDATRWAAYISAAPLSMGSRELYVDDPMLAPVHEAYIEIIANMLAAIGETENLAERAAAYFAIEQARAAFLPPAEAYADIQVLLSTTTWEAVLEATSVTQNVRLSDAFFSRAIEMTVYSPYVDYLAFINSLYVEDNLQALKDAAKLTVFMTFINVLDDDFSGMFDVLMSILFGQPMGGDLTIEDRGQQLVSSLFWRTFSRNYYQRFSSEELKRDVTEMTEDIRAVMREMIEDIPWMSAETRAEAVVKLDSVTAYIAFPDTAIAELPFVVRAQNDGGNLIEFMKSVARLSYELWLELIDGPANISIWKNLPTYVVNAFYNPMENAIIIPAGILQYPFYCVSNSREQNLGAIGAVIAHEFVHAFDPMGSQFDIHGTMTNWWTEEDFIAFEERNARVIAILNEIEFAGMNLIGALNVNETVTDLGAMEVAITVARRMEDADLAQVMIAWARIWATRATPEVAQFIMMQAPHLPSKLRANFILAQLDEFYEVFGVVYGDGMYIPVEERFSFWR